MGGMLGKKVLPIEIFALVMLSIHDCGRKSLQLVLKCFCVSC